MEISLACQAAADATLPLPRVKVYTSSALPLEISGIPDEIAGGTVTAVKVSVTNADGVTVIGTAVKSGRRWLVLFAPSSFANYGNVSKGVRVTVTVTREDNSTADVILGVADFAVVAATASAQPGDPSAHYQVKGGDEFFKSYVAAGVQHYVKQVVSFDPAIGWGADWTGDYILSASGDFVPFVSES